MPRASLRHSVAVLSAFLCAGPNGAGKSTLLKSLSGVEPLIQGSRRLGEGAKLAVFSQDLAQDLPLEMPALEYVLAKAREDDPNITTEQGRKSLGSLGLAGESAQRPIGQLSGGEKARVALAAFALIPYNLLLLDECVRELRCCASLVCVLSSLLTSGVLPFHRPSNHLDAGTIDALTVALQSFEGAILAITHNVMFANVSLASASVCVCCTPCFAGTDCC
jgi:ATPase subunit of ABC transporter with duplicated ATPase domains